eukprot:357665-Chlamydomonas_euryale.AAC.5
MERRARSSSRPRNSVIEAAGRMRGGGRGGFLPKAHRRTACKGGNCICKGWQEAATAGCSEPAAGHQMDSSPPPPPPLVAAAATDRGRGARGNRSHGNRGLLRSGSGGG